jgi:7-cyano-7-deazaguanine synthase
VGDADQPCYLPVRSLDRIAVLASGGLDSCVLLADLAAKAQVFPIYVRFGLAWEEEEQKALRAFSDALAAPNVAPIEVLELPVGGVYGSHWSTTGEGVPASSAPDRDVYLPGRNVLLIGLTAVWCSLHAVSQIAIGSLDENPFSDATPQFFADYARLLSGALSHPIEVIAPYRGLHKQDLIKRHENLPLELTLTCMAPRDGRHCGACNKCFERQQAFEGAGVEDRTRYLTPPRSP